MSEKTMKCWMKVSLVAVICMFMANSVSALTMSTDPHFPDTTANWTDSSIWFDPVTTNLTGVVPTAGDKAYIRSGYTINSSGNVPDLLLLVLGNDTTTYGTPSGTLNITAGTFTVGAGGGSVAAQIGLGATAQGVVRVSGTGKWVGRVLMGSTTAGDANDRFIIEGSNVTVGNTSTVGSNSFEARSGTLEWIFDAAGASTATWQEVVTFGANSQGIIIDGSAYRGVDQPFTVLQAGTLSSTTPPISLIGFGPGASYEWSSATDTLIINAVAIPEPATLGMLGFGALAILIARREIRSRR